MGRVPFSKGELSVAIALGGAAFHGRLLRSGRHGQARDERFYIDGSDGGRSFDLSRRSPKSKLLIWLICIGTAADRTMWVSTGGRRCHGEPVVSVATFLPARETHSVRQALSGSDHILPASSWQDLEFLITSEPIDIVLFDPEADGVMNLDAVTDLIRRYPSLPFVAYVALTRPAFRAVAQLSKQGLEDVVLVRLDDNPPVLRELVRRAGCAPLVMEFLQLIRPELDALPPPISRCVEHLFHQPHRFASAQDLALASGSTLSCLYRSFRCARLYSPKRSLIAARVLRGYAYLTQRDFAFSVREAAAKCGYRHTRIFADHTAEVLGSTPSRLRNGNPHPDVLEAVRAWLVSDSVSYAPDSGPYDEISAPFRRIPEQPIRE